LATPSPNPETAGDGAHEEYEQEAEEERVVFRLSRLENTMKLIELPHG